MDRPTAAKQLQAGACNCPLSGKCARVYAACWFQNREIVSQEYNLKDSTAVIWNALRKKFAVEDGAPPKEG